MTNLRQLSAAALMVATLPLAAASPGFAAGRGPGACTPASASAVGAEGPAMNGGQLMAGVGLCSRLSTGEPYGYAGSYGFAAYGQSYGYRAPSRLTPEDGPDY